MQNKVISRLKFLSVLGLLISAYLLYHHMSLHAGMKEGPSFCSISSSFDCDVVSLSQFSEIGSIPVPAFSVCFFFCLLLLLNFYGNKKQGGFSTTSEQIVSFAFLAIPVTIYFAAISFIFIGSVCLICSLLYILNPLIVFVSSKLCEDKGYLSTVTKGVWSLLDLPFKFLTQAPKASVPSALFVLAILFGPAPVIDWIRDNSRALQDANQASLQSWIDSASYSFLTESEGDDLSKQVFFKGPKNAAVTLVKFSDFECPSCRKAAPKLRAILSSYPKDVKLVYKNFPLDSSCNSYVKGGAHANACKAARAARCAGFQDPHLFWLVHDELFAATKFGDSLFSEIAVLVGEKGNRSAFEECLNADYAVGVKSDINEGVKVEVQGTPSVYINGKPLPYFNEKVARLVIDRILAEKAK